MTGCCKLVLAVRRRSTGRTCRSGFPGTVWRAAYFRFVTTPGVEPTNNLAEQAIRFVVIDRHITQGTRSEGGRQFCERIWTVIATCVQQSQSVYRFLREAVGSWWEGKPTPSLLASASGS